MCIIYFMSNEYLLHVGSLKQNFTELKETLMR